MAIFNFRKRAVKDEKTAQEKEQSLAIDDPLLSALLSDIEITRDKAMTLPMVSSAVDFISGSIACMPVKLYHYKPSQTVTNGAGEEVKAPRRIEEVEGDRRVRLLNGDTGDTLTGYQLKAAMVEDYLLGKGGFAYINRDRRNSVESIHYIQDIYVSVLKNVDPIYKKFVYEVDTKRIWSFDMVKLLRHTKDGATGKSVTKEIANALKTAYMSMIFQLNQFQKGGAKKGFLKSKANLSQESVDKLKEAWRKLYGGNDEDNVVVLNNGIEFQEASATSVELQLNQTRKTLDEDIAKVFHIHPGSFDLTFKEAIYPIVKAFEAAINATMLLESEKKNFYFAFDVKEIVKANIKERYEAYEKAIKMGIKTINEVRRDENMNAIEGMDVLNLGLSAVLYETDDQIFFTPNTGMMIGKDGEIKNGNNNIEGNNMGEKSNNAKEKGGKK